MALAAQVGAGTYKKLGDEAPFSTEFTSKSGVLFSRKLSFGRKPKGVQASAFGVDGVLEPKIGMLPEEATAFGETGVLQRERGHTPFVYRHQGRSSETNAEAIAEFLQAHADAELIEGGKVRCTTTGFELPCDLYWLKSHWEGRKYAKCAARRIAANINAYDKTRPVTRVGKVAHATSKASKPPPGWPPTYDESQHASLLAESQIPYEVLGATTLPKKAVAAAAPKKKKRLSFAEELEEVWTLEDVYQIDQARERLNEKKKAQSDKPPPATPPHPLDLFPTTAATTLDVSEEDDALLRLGGSPSRVPPHPPPAPSPVPPPPLEPPPIEAWKSPDPPPRAAKHSMLSQKAWMRKAEVAAASPITPITTPKAEVQAMVQAPEAAAPAPELSVNEVKAMVKAMRVAELREALTGRGLSAEGLKPALTERLLAAVEEAAAATTTDNTNTNTTMTVDGGSSVKEVADEDNKENGGAVAAGANVMSLGACIMSSKATTASKPVVLQTLASRRSNRLAARNA